MRMAVMIAIKYVLCLKCHIVHVEKNNANDKKKIKTKKKTTTTDVDQCVC